MELEENGHAEPLIGKDTENNTQKSSKKSQDSKKKKDEKILNQALKTLGAFSSPAEKLEALCKKYIELIDDNKKQTQTVKTAEKRIILLEKERDHLQTEQTKSALSRNRLELLCRELQRQNKLMKEENLQRIREEEERRKEVSAKFQTTLSEITALMKQNTESNAKLRDENMEMQNQFKGVYEQYELREQQVEKISKQMKLEGQLADAKLAKAQLELQAQKEILEHDKAQLLGELAMYQQKCQQHEETEISLKAQINAYYEKYDEFQTVLTRSNTVYSGFKTEIEKMSKKISKLERETASWKEKWENTHKALLALAAEKQLKDAENVLQGKQLAQLQKLCRSLQAERTSLLQKINSTSATPEVAKDLTEESDAVEDSNDTSASAVTEIKSTSTDVEIAASEETSEAVSKDDDTNSGAIEQSPAAADEPAEAQTEEIKDLGVVELEAVSQSDSALEKNSHCQFRFLQFSPGPSGASVSASGSACYIPSAEIGAFQLPGHSFDVQDPCATVIFHGELAEKLGKRTCQVETKADLEMLVSQLIRQSSDANNPQEDQQVKVTESGDNVRRSARLATKDEEEGKIFKTESSTGIPKKKNKANTVKIKARKVSAKISLCEDNLSPEQTIVMPLSGDDLKARKRPKKMDINEEGSAKRSKTGKTSRLTVDFVDAEPCSQTECSCSLKCKLSKNPRSFKTESELPSEVKSTEMEDTEVATKQDFQEEREKKTVVSTEECCSSNQLKRTKKIKKTAAEEKEKVDNEKEPIVAQEKIAKSPRKKQKFSGAEKVKKSKIKLPTLRPEGSCSSKVLDEVEVEKIEEKTPRKARCSSKDRNDVGNVKKTKKMWPTDPDRSCFSQDMDEVEGKKIKERLAISSPDASSYSEEINKAERCSRKKDKCFREDENEVEKVKKTKKKLPISSPERSCHSKGIIGVEEELPVSSPYKSCLCKKTNKVEAEKFSRNKDSRSSMNRNEADQVLKTKKSVTFSPDRSCSSQDLDLSGRKIKEPISSPDGTNKPEKTLRKTDKSSSKNRNEVGKEKKVNQKLPILRPDEDSSRKDLSQKKLHILSPNVSSSGTETSEIDLVKRVKGKFHLSPVVSEEEEESSVFLCGSASIATIRNVLSEDEDDFVSFDELELLSFTENETVDLTEPKLLSVDVSETPREPVIEPAVNFQHLSSESQEKQEVNSAPQKSANLLSLEMETELEDAVETSSEAVVAPESHPSLLRVDLEDSVSPSIATANDGTGTSTVFLAAFCVLPPEIHRPLTGQKEDLNMYQIMDFLKDDVSKAETEHAESTDQVLEEDDLQSEVSKIDLSSIEKQSEECLDHSSNEDLPTVREVNPSENDADSFKSEEEKKSGPGAEIEKLQLRIHPSVRNFWEDNADSETGRVNKALTNLKEEFAKMAKKVEEEFLNSCQSFANMTIKPGLAGEPKELIGWWPKRTFPCPNCSETRERLNYDSKPSVVSEIEVGKNSSTYKPRCKYCERLLLEEDKPAVLKIRPTLPKDTHRFSPYDIMSILKPYKQMRPMKNDAISTEKAVDLILSQAKSTFHLDATSKVSPENFGLIEKKAESVTINGNQKVTKDSRRKSVEPVWPEKDVLPTPTTFHLDRTSVVSAERFCFVEQKAWSENNKELLSTSKLTFHLDATSIVPAASSGFVEHKAVSESNGNQKVSKTMMLKAVNPVCPKTEVLPSPTTFHLDRTSVVPAESSGLVAHKAESVTMNENQKASKVSMKKAVDPVWTEKDVLPTSKSTFHHDRTPAVVPAESSGLVKHKENNVTINGNQKLSKITMIAEGPKSVTHISIQSTGTKIIVNAQYIASDENSIAEEPATIEKLIERTQSECRITPDVSEQSIVCHATSSISIIGREPLAESEDIIILKRDGEVCATDKGNVIERGLYNMDMKPKVDKDERHPNRTEIQLRTKPSQFAMSEGDSVTRLSGLSSSSISLIGKLMPTKPRCPEDEKKKMQCADTVDILANGPSKPRCPQEQIPCSESVDILASAPICDLMPTRRFRSPDEEKNIQCFDSLDVLANDSRCDVLEALSNTGFSTSTAGGSFSADWDIFVKIIAMATAAKSSIATFSLDSLSEHENLTASVSSNLGTCLRASESTTIELSSRTSHLPGNDQGRGDAELNVKVTPEEIDEGSNDAGADRRGTEICVAGKGSSQVMIVTDSNGRTTVGKATTDSNEVVVGDKEVFLQRASFQVRTGDNKFATIVITDKGDDGSGTPNVTTQFIINNDNDKYDSNEQFCEDVLSGKSGSLHRAVFTVKTGDEQYTTIVVTDSGAEIVRDGSVACLKTAESSSVEANSFSVEADSYSREADSSSRKAARTSGESNNNGPVVLL